MRISLWTKFVVVLVALTTMVVAAPRAQALDNDQWCNWGEVCVADLHNGGWQLWTNQNDINSYYWYDYATSGLSVNNRSDVALNAGLTCDVTIYSGYHYWGDEVTLSNNAQWTALGAVGVDRASSHDFCAS